MIKSYRTPEVTDFGSVPQLTGVAGGGSAQDVFVNLTQTPFQGFPPGETIGTGSQGGCWDASQGQECHPNNGAL